MHRPPASDNGARNRSDGAHQQRSKNLIWYEIAENLIVLLLSTWNRSCMHLISMKKLRARWRVSGERSSCCHDPLGQLTLRIVAPWSNRWSKWNRQWLVTFLIILMQNLILEFKIFYFRLNLIYIKKYNDNWDFGNGF